MTPTVDDRSQLLDRGGHLYMVVAAVFVGLAGALGAVLFRLLIRTVQAIAFEGTDGLSTLVEEGIAAEVIDVATLKPLDMDSILASVAKTGRCVIVHEAARTSGVGAEIAANIAEHGLYSLLAPVQRVTGYDVVTPYFGREKNYIPSTGRVVRGIEETLDF